MRALRFDQTGSLENLRVEEVSLPKPGAGEALVQMKAAAINPSDVKNVLGKMHTTTLPRIPGRDFAGVVIAGPAGLIGQSVFGSGGTLGFQRDGSHAEYLTVPASAVIPLPRNLSFEQAAGIGVAYITAWASLVNAAQTRLGETVLILGTTGAVGSAAARIAYDLGARVIGTVRKRAEITGDLPVDHWIDLEATELASGARQATGGRGADVVLDLVGGAMFEPCLTSLAWRGRQVSISSGPDPRVSFNLPNFYHNELKLIGVDSLKLTFDETGEILRRLVPGIEAGKFKPPQIEMFSLEDGPRVYRELAESKIKAKAVLVT